MEITVADYIASQLFKAGVRYVFGIPGGPSIPYIEAFSKAGIRFILVSNEAAAGIMADVTSRITGIPGICHATFGPGAANISTGIGGALLDRSAVIVLTSEMDDDFIHRTAQMNISHQKLFEPITKATFRVDENNVAEILERSLSICKTEYPGPVHLGLPSGTALKEVISSNDGALKFDNKTFRNEPDKIRKLLEQSRRPLIAAGLTAKRVLKNNELTDFLDRCKIPVIVTPMAKGIIPAGHPCYAGVLFHALSNYLEDIYQKCDLVIGLGYDQVEYNYESWLPEVPLVHFDTLGTDLPCRENIFSYFGKPDEWFDMLGSLDRGSLIFEGTLVKGIRDEMVSYMNSFLDHFGPVTALNVLRKELPGDAILTSDVGSHLHLIGQYWDCGTEGTLLMTNGWSGMGFGIPAAIAAKMCRPDTPVVCITGDGGFLMMAGEIVTALRYNLPVIFVVFSDGELNLIKLKQSWKNLPPEGTIIYKDDLFRSDTFLGVRVLRANNEESMTSAVNEALRAGEPLIINAVIDPEDYNFLVVKQ